MRLLQFRANSAVSLEPGANLLGFTVITLIYDDLHNVSLFFNHNIGLLCRHEIKVPRCWNYFFDNISSKMNLEIFANTCRRIPF